jgi:hypothetical protein
VKTRIENGIEYQIYDAYALDLSGDDVLLDEVLGDDLDSALDVDFVSLDVDLGVGRSFIRCGNTSEFCLSAISPINQYGLAACDEMDSPLISPALAFLYNPLGSLLSTTLNGASTKTSMNGTLELCFSCNSLASCRSEI